MLLCHPFVALSSSVVRAQHAVVAQHVVIIIFCVIIDCFVHAE